MKVASFFDDVTNGDRCIRQWISGSRSLFVVVGQLQSEQLFGVWAEFQSGGIDSRKMERGLPPDGNSVWKRDIKSGAEFSEK
jgi:hypothetical protein